MSWKSKNKNFVPWDRSAPPTSRPHRLASPPRPAARRPALPQPWDVRDFDSTSVHRVKYYFLDMPCHRKGFTETNRRRYVGQQPGTKSFCCPADKPVVNRTLCSPTGLHRISFVRACEETFRTVVYDALEGKRDGRLLGEPTCRRPVLPRPVPPRRPAVRRPAPTCLWYVRGLDSTGLTV